MEGGREGTRGKPQRGQYTGVGMEGMQQQQQQRQLPPPSLQQPYYKQYSPPLPHHHHHHQQQQQQKRLICMAMASTRFLYILPSLLRAFLATIRRRRSEGKGREKERIKCTHERWKEVDMEGGVEGREGMDVRVGKSIFDCDR